MHFVAVTRRALPGFGGKQMSRVHTEKRQVMGSNTTLVTTVTHEPDPDPEPPEPGSQHPSASAMTSHTPLAATRSGDPQLVDAHDRIRDAERRVTEIDDELAALGGNLLDERDHVSTDRHQGIGG